eukprot:6286083-Prymnesium_polylepis.2
MLPANETQTLSIYDDMHYSDHGLGLASCGSFVGKYEARLREAPADWRGAALAGLYYEKTRAGVLRGARNTVIHRYFSRWGEADTAHVLESPPTPQPPPREFTSHRCSGSR